MALNRIVLDTAASQAKPSVRKAILCVGLNN
ncbi:hypothetical protein J2S11_001858 [Bacillus horti]|uniref:50S ribosomal protein L14 n=1 Tax=Caldalkalibacillus horti TaxID=77523 RepID=A0ABT9VYB0_9BACI|nr:hypothetical protein [Bacillus horti]